MNSKACFACIETDAWQYMQFIQCSWTYSLSLDNLHILFCLVRCWQRGQTTRIEDFLFIRNLNLRYHRGIMRPLWKQSNHTYIYIYIILFCIRRTLFTRSIIGWALSMGMVWKAAASLAKKYICLDITLDLPILHPKRCDILLPSCEPVWLGIQQARKGLFLVSINSNKSTHRSALLAYSALCKPV